jgi:hypothetical protein
MLEMLVDVSYATPQVLGYVNVALHREYSPGIIVNFTLSSVEEPRQEYRELLLRFMQEIRYPRKWTHTFRSAALMLS